MLCLGLPITLGGCGAIETYRSITGVNKDDPDPKTAVFSGNMAAAETAPYPNLATVPPPPTRASTAAERKKLADTLVAERAATAASAGVSPEAVAEQPPSHGAPLPVAGAPEPAQRTVQTVQAETPARGATPPAQRSAQPEPPAHGATPPSGAATGKGAEPKIASREPAAGRNRANKPPEPLPRDSTLQMPQVTATPQPDVPRPPPAPPALGRVTPPAAFAPPPVASVMPAPPPPAPELPLPPPPPAITAITTPRPAAAAPTTVATVELSGSRLDSTARAEIDRVAALYKAKPASVRVIARTPPRSPGTDPLGDYRKALDSAQAVADALKAAGIPADKLRPEALSGTSGTAAPAGRVEIQFVP
jgi:hypothetical protein